MAWVREGNVRGPQGVPAADQVTGSLAGVTSALTLWIGSQTQYDAITNKDDRTVYIVT